MSCDIAHLLELRVRLRRSPEGRAIVDRCLSIVARAAAAEDPQVLARLKAEARALEDELALRFGAPRSAVLQ